MRKAMIILCCLSVAGVGSSYVYSSVQKNLPLPGVANAAKVFSLTEATAYPVQQQPGKTPKSTAAKKPVAKAGGKPGGTKSTTAVSKKDIEQGQQLIGKSDCLACHKVDVKLVGPAYADVAKKYPANATNIDMLAQKVIKGGSGVWGAVPMTPHPTIAPGDARNMVKYILSLNSK